MHHFVFRTLWVNQNRRVIATKDLLTASRGSNDITAQEHHVLLVHPLWSLRRPSLTSASLTMGTPRRCFSKQWRRCQRWQRFGSQDITAQKHHVCFVHLLRRLRRPVINLTKGIPRICFWIRWRCCRRCQRRQRRQRPWLWHGGHRLGCWELPFHNESISRWSTDRR